MGRLLSRLRQYTRGHRNKRFRAFLDKLRPAEPERLIKVLDLGGTVPFWQAWNITTHDKLHLTLVNDHVSDAKNNVESESPFIVNRRSDVLTLTNDDFRSFDLIFSNSMIEHLSSRHAQRELADRIGASGVPYFIQVPEQVCSGRPTYPSTLPAVLWRVPEACPSTNHYPQVIRSGGSKTSIARGGVRKFPELLQPTWHTGYAGAVPRCEGRVRAGIRSADVHLGLSPPSRLDWAERPHERWHQGRDGMP